ncbi:hypothetical protein GQ457_08G020150 [Hibiscus cannabinus]
MILHSISPSCSFLHGFKLVYLNTSKYITIILRALLGWVPSLKHFIVKVTLGKLHREIVVLDTYHTDMICTAGLPSDVNINIGEMCFHLHKKWGMLRKLIEECSTGDGASFSLRLDDLPGGAKAFELISKFCYGVRIELTAHMCTWADSIRALEACEEVMSYAEELHIVSRCIDSLAMKACEDPSLYGWPLAGRESKQSPENTALWNGISTPTRRNLPAKIGVVHYARRYLPLMNRQSSFRDANQGKNIPKPSEADQRALLEEIVGLFLTRRESHHPSSSLDFFVRLWYCMQVHPAEKIWRRESSTIGSSFTYRLAHTEYELFETRYDIDCVQRILDHFLLAEQASAVATPANIVEEGQLVDGSDILGPMTMVACLIDEFLAEVAADVNFKLCQFETLAASIPDYARPLDDGLYQAIDVYLKAHPWITDVEREQLCRLMDCQKLSIEASTHCSSEREATTSSDRPIKPNGNLGLKEGESHPIGSAEHGATNDGEDDMKHRVSELEKDCLV